MQTPNQMSSEQPYRLGFTSLRFDPDTIDRMLRFLEVPWESTHLRRVVEDELAALHTVLMLNPILGQLEWDSVFHHVEAGGTAMVLLSPSMSEHAESVHALERLGLRIGYTRAVKRLNLQYSATYPVPHKRAKGGYMLSHERGRFATFHPVSAKAEHVPLISAKGFMANHCVVMQVNLGRGAFVFSNSQSLPEDRADLVGYLLRLAGERKPMPLSKTVEPMSRTVCRAITSLFEVYEEIPLDVVARDIAAAGHKCSRLELLSAIESSIRNGDLPAKLRGETVVKAW